MIYNTMGDKMSNECVKKQLFKITWPIFIDTLLFMFLGSMDVFMLGRFSDNSVAAVGAVNQIISMINLIFGIITAGTMILCSQYLGTKDPKENIIRLSGVSIVFNGLIGAILSIVLVFSGEILLKYMNIDNSLILISSSYINIVGGFLFIQSMAMTFTAIIRAHGYTKVCMYVTFFMNVLNIICNYILIFGNCGGPILGVKGAAIATVLSKTIGCVILGYFLFTKVIKDFSLRYFKKFPKKDLINMLIIGLQTAGEQLSYSLMQIVITMILTLIGIEAMTTNNYANNIIMFVYVFAVSIGQGSSILVGRLIGKGDTESAYSLGISSLKKAILVSLLLAMIIASCGRYILGVFTINEKIISLGIKLLLIDIILEPGRAFNLVIINCLRGAGDVKFPVCVGLVSMWILGAGAGYILAIPFNLGLNGIWIALALDEWIRGIIMYFRWKSGKWKGKCFVN